MVTSVFSRRMLACVLVAACLGGLAAGRAHAQWTWAEGGLLDGSTGLAWSQSQRLETGSWWTWNGAKTNAANYVVPEYDEAGNVIAVYDDWRVPTVAELQIAIANGTINQVLPKNPEGDPLWAGEVFLWSSEARGTKGWAVRVKVNGLGEVIGGGDAKLFLKASGFEVYFVRNAAP